MAVFITHKMEYANNVIPTLYSTMTEVNAKRSQTYLSANHTHSLLAKNAKAATITIKIVT